MKNKILILAFISLTFAFTKQDKTQLPEGFVYVKDLIPDIDVELRYFTNHNFVGDTINGYKANRLILTQQSAEALKKYKMSYNNKICV